MSMFQITAFFPASGVPAGRYACGDLFYGDRAGAEAYLEGIRPEMETKWLSEFAVNELAPEPPLMPEPPYRSVRATGSTGGDWFDEEG